MINIIKPGDTINKILLTIVAFCLIYYHKEGWDIQCPSGTGRASCSIIGPGTGGDC
jgi:hypothetical protein